MTPLQDWWFGSLFGLGGGYRDDRPTLRHGGTGATPPPRPATRLGGPRTPPGAAPSTYRTMCVRLCDGYYFPISYSVSRERFAKDARTCESLCSGEARLFVYRNPGEEADNMEDLEGKPYRQLRAAFLYRTEYVPSCKCRPHPWEKEARDRHRVYALGAAAKKGSKEAEKELKSLQQSDQAGCSHAQRKADGRVADAKAADERAPSRRARNSLSPTRGGAPIMRLGVSGKPRPNPPRRRG